MAYFGVNLGAAWMDGGVAGLLFGAHSVWLPVVIILVAYHIILAWLVISAEHDSGLSLSIPETILTHLACLAVLLFFSAVARYVPFMGYLRYAMPGLAPFERDWLFKAKKKDKEKKVPVSKEKADAVASAVAAAATIDDYQDWLKYLAQPNRPPRKPGTSVQDEYKQWLLARARAKIVPPKR